MANPKGYDYEPTTSSRYLNLKAKGDTAVFRIVSMYENVKKHWVVSEGGKRQPVNCTDDKMCPYCGEDVPADEKIKVTEVFGWLVIDRADGQVKVFKAPPQVYKGIKALILDKEWGAPEEGFPLSYDIKVERTEEKPNYYRVTPLPRGMGEITEEEKKVVSESRINLLSELKEEGRQQGGETGSAGANELETATPDKVEVPDIKEEDATNDEDDDDIPF